MTVTTEQTTKVANASERGTTKQRTQDAKGTATDASAVMRVATQIVATATGTLTVVTELTQAPKPPTPLPKSTYTPIPPTKTPTLAPKPTQTPATSQMGFSASAGGAQWNGKNLSDLDGNDYAQMDRDERIALVTILERAVPYCQQTVQQGVDALSNIYSDPQMRGTRINEAFAAWEALAGCHKPSPTTMAPTAQSTQTQEQIEAGWVKQDGDTWLKLNADGKAAYAQALLRMNCMSSAIGCVIPDISAFSLTVPGVVAAMDLYETHADARLRGLPLITVFMVAMTDGNENCPHPYDDNTPAGLPCYPGAK